MKMRAPHLTAAMLAYTLSISTALASDLPAPNADNNVYFGDVHVHTGWSFDAFTNGSKTTPTDAYAWAQGKPITGSGGRLLSGAWADGPQAHLGLTVAGFPNLFLMLGPNTATGHTSTLLFIEPGVAWVLRAMAELQRRGARWLDVRPAVMQAYNDGLQARLQGSVWSTCRSWYRADNGRNIALFPGFTGEYVRAVGAQSFGDFEFG